MEHLKQGIEHIVIDFDRAGHSQARPPWCRVRQGRAGQGRGRAGQGTIKTWQGQFVACPSPALNTVKADQGQGLGLGFRQGK